MTSEYKFKIGEIVYDRVRPHQKLVVEKIVGKIYYCQDVENFRGSTQVYFERDIKGSDT